MQKSEICGGRVSARRRKNMQHTTISDLPDEMLEMVFDQLSVDDLKNVSLVCKRWSYLAFSGRRMNRVKLPSRYELDEQKTNCLLQSSRNYRNLGFYIDREQFAYAKALVHKFSFSLLTLDLWIAFGTVNHFRLIMLETPKIQHLKIFVPSRETDEPIEPLPVMSELKYLHLVSGCGLTHRDGFNLRTFAPSLQRLEMWCNDQKHLAVWSQVSRQLRKVDVHCGQDMIHRFCELTFPRLKNLSFSYSIYLRTVRMSCLEAIQNFMKRHNSLRRLCIRTIPLSFVQLIASNFSELTHLTMYLDPYKQWQEGSLQPLGQLSKLTHLKCSGPAEINIFGECKAITTLKSFCIDGLDDISLEFIREFFEVAPQLKCLVIDSKEVTGDVLQFICENFRSLTCLKVQWLSKREGYGLSRMNCLPFLRKLDLRIQGRFKWYMHSMPRTKVRYLTLRGNWKLNSTELLKLPDIFPQLERLTLIPICYMASSVVKKLRRLYPACSIIVKGNLKSDAELDELQFDRLFGGTMV